MKQLLLILITLCFVVISYAPTTVWQWTTGATGSGSQFCKDVYFDSNC